MVRGLDDALPIYPVYALLFSDTGVSDAEIGLLLAAWSLAVVVLEIPTGAWADVIARHRVLALSGVIRAAGFALWVLAPSVPSFAAGFALWALGGSLVSGTLESHVHDALAARGAAGTYRVVAGRSHVAALVGTALAASTAPFLLALGGYTLTGLVSSAVCLVFALVALRLPDPAASGWRRRPVAGGTAPGESEDRGHAGPLADGRAEDHPWRAWWHMLRAGVREAATHPPVRHAVLLAAVVWAALALDEFFPLLARTSGFSNQSVPWVMLAVSIVQAGGAWAAAHPRVGGGTAGICLAACLLLVVGCLAAAGTWPVWLAWGAICLGYGLGQLAVVLVEARVQASVRGTARATVTSVASLLSELLAIGLYASWALAADPWGRPAATALLAAPLLIAVPLALLTGRLTRRGLDDAELT